MHAFSRFCHIQLFPSRRRRRRSSSFRLSSSPPKFRPRGFRPMREQISHFSNSRPTENRGRFGALTPGGEIITGRRYGQSEAPDIFG